MGSPGDGRPASPTEPLDPDPPEEPIVADPGAAAEARAEDVATQSGRFGSQEVPAHKPSESEDEDEEEEDHWITIRLEDEQGNPVPGEKWEIITPEGKKAKGSLNSDGEYTLKLTQGGTCEVSFPNLDKDAWSKA